jgi:hypothetical protein
LRFDVWLPRSSAKDLACSHANILLIACALICAAPHCPFHPADGTETFGDYIVHYSALSTMRLNTQMASRYHIERAANRGLLNVSVQKMAADGTTTAVGAEISGEAVNLTGQKTKITIREIPDLYVSYIGLYEVAAPDTYSFNLNIKPAGSERTFELRFSQNFVAE